VSHVIYTLLTLKVRASTLNKLRMIHALTGNNMLYIVDVLATQELTRLGIDEKKYNELITHPKDKDCEPA